MADSPFIFEADPQNFQQVVLENSRHVPVLVDFWADWCQPCQTLMPMLAKLADEYQGGFILVKVNTDQHQQLAAQFGVRNLPTVKILKDGQVVDEFVGVQPEPEIRKLIDKHRTRQTEPYRQQAQEMFQAGDMDGAVQLMEQVIQHEPDFHEAAVELCGMYLQLDRADDAAALLEKIPADAVDSQVMTQLQAEIRQAQLQSQVSDVDATALEQRIADNPDDLEALLELAKLRIATGQQEEGLELYFRVHMQDREFQDGAAKKGLFEAFELLGGANPLVRKYRNKLFSQLY